MSYDSLVLKAREGQTDPVLDYLEAEAARGPLPSGHVEDWMVIASWAERDADVVKVYERYLGTMRFSKSAVVAAARAYRSRQEWDKSLLAWDAAIGLDGSDDSLRIARIYTLADAGHDASALSEVKKRIKRAPTAENYALLSYVHLAAWHSLNDVRRLFDAVEASDRAFAMKPDGTPLQAYVNALQTARISRRAADVGVPAPDNLVSPGQKRWLETDAIAELVLLVLDEGAEKIPSPTEAERFVVPDRALAAYQSFLERWGDDPQAASAVLQARIDRIGALVSRYRMKEAIAVYEELLKEGHVLPDVARRWVAGAYLYEREPEIAARIYRELYENDPQRFSQGDRPADELSYFYAMSENNEHYAARRHVEAAALKYSMMMTYLGSAVQTSNPLWQDAQLIKAQSLLYSQLLPEAHLEFANLAAQAPGNEDFRVGLASVYLVRGWPRRAEEELKIAETVSPRSLSVIAEQGAAALELQEWAQVDILADDAIGRFPESLTARRLERLRQVHHMSELRVKGYRGLVSDSPVSGNRDYGLDTVLYSPPILDNWRLFAGWGIASGYFDEGRGLLNTYRAGIEWTGRDNWVEAEISRRRYRVGNDVGLRLSGWHDFDDHWRVGGTLEKFSEETPLRALASNITSDGGSFYVRWYGSEQRDWTLTVAPSHYSDGNTHIEYGLAGRERLWTTPYVFLDLDMDLAATHNTRQGGPYFSPENDISAVPALSFNHDIYRRYETVWSQQIRGGVGQYWQQQYGADVIWTASYGQRILWNDVLDAGVQAVWQSRPYDGQRENEVQLSFDLNYRF